MLPLHRVAAFTTGGTEGYHPPTSPQPERVHAVQYRIDTESAVWRVIDGEAVVVHSDSSEYFGLNASATALWQVLAASAPSTEQLADLLASWYDREPATALVEAAAFVEGVHEAGLITRITDGTDGSVDPTPPPRSGPYEAPILVKFGDLDALILSGE